MLPSIAYCPARPFRPRKYCLKSCLVKEEPAGDADGARDAEGDEGMGAGAGAGAGAAPPPPKELSAAAKKKLLEAAPS